MADSMEDPRRADVGQRRLIGSYVAVVMVNNRCDHVHGSALTLFSGWLTRIRSGPIWIRFHRKVSFIRYMRSRIPRGENRNILWPSTQIDEACESEIDEPGENAGGKAGGWPRVQARRYGGPNSRRFHGHRDWPHRRRGLGSSDPRRWTNGCRDQEVDQRSERCRAGGNRVACTRRQT